ncbi:alpha/beta hydrolase [Marinimicrococcus flavescens]|uniref:Alpha/beta hydrolase n=1 Tax=Marinimicrococcus flavescens TaxID=3031815 RepID=A0AAP3UYX2_9PROT|nr:alpha/beta hydrolase [Marinimicrococcus flavescens]
MREPSALATELLPSGIRCVALVPRGGARATVLVLPGRGEFIEKYRETTSRLLGRRLAVVKFDWRGQGGSRRLLPQRHRGHIADFADYLEDLEQVVAWIRRQELPGRCLILAHSMGGHVALRRLATAPEPFLAAAMIAPMFDIRLSLPRWVVEMIARAGAGLGAAGSYLPGQRDPDLARGRFEGNRLTSCPESWALWRELLARHRHLALGGVTYGWLAAGLRSIRLSRAPDMLERVMTPILVLQAGQDRLVCNLAQEEFVRRLPAARLERFPDARHDLLWERTPVREAALESITDFFEAALAEPGRLAAPLDPADSAVPSG